MQSERPIGIFDSGIGGLTVASAISNLLPEEHLIYFGDTAHLPYGEKSPDAIRYYCLKIAKFLIEQDCKMIVVACNSASTAAYELLLEFFQEKVLFANVVDPLVKAAIEISPKKLGLIATKTTVGTGVYQRKIKEAKLNIEVAAMATPLLVPMIEEGYFQNKISHTVIENYLEQTLLQNIEMLLLACTHYPLIRSEIETYYGGKVKVLDSNLVVAKQVKETLVSNKLLNQRKSKAHRFYVSDYTESFKKTAQLFYKDEIQLEHLPFWNE